MSHIVDSVPPRGVHPWHRWFDGELRELVKGEDFHCSPHNFRGSVVYAASRRGVEIEVFKVRRDRVYLKAVLR